MGDRGREYDDGCERYDDGHGHSHGMDIWGHSHGSGEDRTLWVWVDGMEKSDVVIESTIIWT